MSRALLITGATGKQGGAVVRALLSQNADFEILAVSRDTSSPSAQKLASLSPRIKLVQGDLDQSDDIFKAAKRATSTPIWGVFSVQVPAFNKEGPKIETKQGKALIDASLANGVRHFVYSSVDRGGERSLSNPTNVPHFRSKHAIEEYLLEQAGGGKSSATTSSSTKSAPTAMSWTILRPVAFMDNFSGDFFSKVFATAWRVAVRSRPLQLIATEDIAWFAVKAFQEPAWSGGKSISLAGDELTFEDTAKVYRQATGSDMPTTWGFVARFIMWMSEEMGTMYSFFEREGYGADIAELKNVHPGLMDLGMWLRKQNNTKTG